MKARPTGVTKDVIKNTKLMSIGLLQEEYDVLCNGFAAVFLTRLRNIRLCAEYNATHCSPERKLSSEDFHARFRKKGEDYIEVISANAFVCFCGCGTANNSLTQLKVRTASDPKGLNQNVRLVYEDLGFSREKRNELQQNARAHDMGRGSA